MNLFYNFEVISILENNSRLALWLSHVIRLKPHFGNRFSAVQSLTVHLLCPFVGICARLSSRLCSSFLHPPIHPCYVLSEFYKYFEIQVKRLLPSEAFSVVNNAIFFTENIINTSFMVLNYNFRQNVQMGPGT